MRTPMTNPAPFAMLSTWGKSPIPRVTTTNRSRLILSFTGRTISSHEWKSSTYLDVGMSFKKIHAVLASEYGTTHKQARSPSTPGEAPH